MNRPLQYGSLRTGGRRPSSPLSMTADRAWNEPDPEETKPPSRLSASRALITRPRCHRQRGTGGPHSPPPFDIRHSAVPHPPIPQRTIDHRSLLWDTTARQPPQTTARQLDVPDVARRFQPVPARGRIPDRPWSAEALFMDGPGPYLARLRARSPGHGAPPDGGFTSSIVPRQSSIFGLAVSRNLSYEACERSRIPHPVSRIAYPAACQPSLPASGWPTMPAALTDH